MEAETTSDAESRSKLLGAAKLLADATTNMVEVAKVYAQLTVLTTNSLWFHTVYCSCMYSWLCF